MSEGNLVKYIDDFFTEEEYKEIFDYCLKAPYFYGEGDNPDTPPVGMVSEILELEISDMIADRIKKSIPEVSNLSIYRMYINCFAPGEIPYFHIDNETGITCIYYVNPEFELNNNGETQFIIDNESANVLPIPNRMCYFDSSIMHRATSYRKNHRFTIAIKYA